MYWYVRIPVESPYATQEKMTRESQMKNEKDAWKTEMEVKEPGTFCAPTDHMPFWHTRGLRDDFA